MTTTNSSQFEAVIAAIDEANAEDVRLIAVEGTEYPFETVYADRMTETMTEMYPDASELLRIAARAQHIRRWEIPRDQYPKNRQGYQKWRLTLRKMHAQMVGDIMSRNGYSENDIARVGMFLQKQSLKKDAESQALENVVDVVFLDYYWDDFVAKYSDYDDEKLIDIVGKTLRKMSTKGHQAALALDLPPETTRIVLAAVEREKDNLAALAKVEVG
ncbi:MAG: DUF4202 domain-containing protein [Paracoccaceae bacterium]|jgi:hypothetical protein